MQPDRQKDRAKELHCEVVLYGAAEPSGESLRHCILASCGKQRLIALRYLSAKRNDGRHCLREPKLCRKCRTIGNECRVFGILIGADQKAVTPVAVDGRKIELIEDRNPIIARRMPHPVLKDAANVSSFLRICGLHTRLSEQVLQSRAPECLLAGYVGSNC